MCKKILFAHSANTAQHSFRVVCESSSAAELSMFTMIVIVIKAQHKNPCNLTV